MIYKRKDSVLGQFSTLPKEPGRDGERRSHVLAPGLWKPSDLEVEADMASDLLSSTSPFSELYVLGSFRGQCTCRQRAGDGGWGVRLCFCWTSHRTCQRSKGGGRVERECCRKQELMASGPQRLLQPCPREGSFRFPTRIHPSKTTLAKCFFK